MAEDERTKAQEKPAQQPPQRPPQQARPPARPPTAPTARPPAPPRPTPPTKPTPPRLPTQLPPVIEKRRRFLHFAATLGGLATLATFVPMGSYLTRVAGRDEVEEKQKILLLDGTFANIKTFAPNTSAVFVFPRTGDPKKDAEPFKRWQLIRLPKEYGGEANDISSFRAYSMICVHLWCLWDYKPLVRDERSGAMKRGFGECPCHGSIYDIRTGKAIRGPASLQAPPANVLPKLDLELDSEGFIRVKPPVFTLDKNGVIGFGRYL